MHGNITSVLECIGERSLDLEEGFALKIESDLHRADAMNRLALITTRISLFNRFNHPIFNSVYVLKIVYPFVRIGRKTLLNFMGIKKLDKVSFPTRPDRSPDGS